MADLVENVLQAASQKEAKYKSIEVQKDIELDIDEGNLLAIDSNPLDLKRLRSKREAYLKDLARDNTQLLINKLFQLPVERTEDVILAKLSSPRTILPREKPVPKPKPMTKWEKYANLKGIQNRKKSRMVWDDKVKDWRPRWGYQRANDDSQEWALEVPEGADPFEDQFAKKKKAKRERTAKNELQRLRNIARAQKGKVPGVGLTPTDNPNKDDLGRALAVARKSTASVGKFTDKLPKEKPTKGLGKRRKFESNFGDASQEKKRSLDILGKLQKSEPILDVTKAVNQQQVTEEKKRSQGKGEEPRKGKGKGKGKNRGRKQGNFGGKKGKKSGGGRGKRKGKR